MRKFERTQIFKNIGSSWFSLGVNIGVGIFLSPFILHHLGDAAFGVWVLNISETGYYGLFDLGIRSSIVRYVSKFTAIHDNESLTRVMNTSLLGYTGVGLLSLLITVVLSLEVDRIFHIPAEFHETARWLVLMVGTSVAVGFPLGVFGGMLEGLQRFYILNWTNVVATVLRAVLIVVFLNRGYGLLTVAFITIFLPFLSSLVRCVIALRILPVPFSARYVDRATFREIVHYSRNTFIVMVAGRLKFKTDEIVIGTFLSASAITYFSIGNRIVDYAGQVVYSLAQVFVPMSSQSDATGNMDRLRKIFVAGNRVCAFIIFPICAVLIILGKSVIEVWVGKKYIATSYPVMLIILIPSTLMLAQSASGRVLFGMGKHRTWAFASLLEGICNLLLSIALVRPYGIIGDAIGTAIPLTCTFVFFMPHHLCRRLGIRIRTYLREAYALPLAGCIPLVAALLAMRHWFVPHNYWQLGAELLAAGLVYGPFLLWTYLTKRALAVGNLAAAEEIGRLQIEAVRPVVEA